MEELKRFYKAKEKKPNLFNYDEDGNLIELDKEGSIIKTIPLPIYRKPTYEEIDASEKKRMEAIAIANKEFEDARKQLRNSNLLTDSEIVRLNRNVTEADIKLQAIRFPLKNIQMKTGLSIRHIDFNQPHETRKYPYPFYFLQEHPFTLQEQYVRIGELPNKPLKSLSEIKEGQKVPVILFSDTGTNDYGYLSLKWDIEIEFNNTIYNSVQQGLYGEIAKAFDDQTNLNKIMLAEPDAINYSVEDIPGDENEGKWNDLLKKLLYDINIIKFKQYPELTGRLLETKTALLGAYIPNDNLIGIGISLDNIQSKNSAHWTGQNILGKALMDIREKIRTERSELKSIPEPVEQVQPVEVEPEQVEQVQQPEPVEPVEPVQQPEPVEPVQQPVQPVQQPEQVQQPIPRPIRRRPRSSVQNKSLT